MITDPPVTRSSVILTVAVTSGSVRPRPASELQPLQCGLQQLQRPGHLQLHNTHLPHASSHCSRLTLVNSVQFLPVNIMHPVVILR